MQTFPRRARFIWLCIGLPMLVLAGCNVYVRTSGAESIDELQAEDTYRAVYAEHMHRLHQDLQLFAPTETSPGVCNAGGELQGCHDAGEVVIADLEAMRSALEDLEIPPRYEAGHAALMDAIETNIRGLQLRNDAIARKDNELWQEHRPVLEGVAAQWQAAYEAFPEDNRPAPAP